MNSMTTPERLEKMTRVASNRQRDFVLVFEDILDPHNIQAAVRTADAFGVQDIHVIFDRAPHVNLRQVGKLSSSTVNSWMTYHTHKTTKDCLSQLKDDGYTLYATALTDDSVDFFDVDFTATEKVALLFGTERHGLSEEALTLSDVTMQIPMQGIVQSLNLSVTAAIATYEVFRQRRMSNVDYHLSSSAVNSLIAQWSAPKRRNIKKPTH
jgi:tRNA (guanosine-2'-O-)-methyltransferase